MRLSLQQLKIPFRHSFSHASATRMETEAVLVKAVSASGVTGYGEGCPRSYVTGETLETVERFFSSFEEELSGLEDLESLSAWQAQHAAEIDENPSAWCAVELAILDVLSRDREVPVESFLSLAELSGVFQYTGVLGAEGMGTFGKVMAIYQQVGFTDFKLKVSGDLELDRQKVESLKENASYRMRLDGNNLWRDADEASAYVEALDASFMGVEEPLAAKDFESMRRFRDQTGVRIILDESFLTVQDFEQIAEDPEAWIINLRISKMGGLLRSLEIAERAEEGGVGLIIGAQVGETSILTRAALTVAAQHRGRLLGQEGAFGTHLLEHDVTEEPISFAAQGQLDATHLGERPGLGISCDA